MVFGTHRHPRRERGRTTEESAEGGKEGTERNYYHKDTENTETKGF
jgi:hypothetical protein